MRIDTRWGVRNTDDARQYAAELIALAPNVILATGSAAVAGLQQVTRIVPIVFVQNVDTPKRSEAIHRLAELGLKAKVKWP